MLRTLVRPAVRKGVCAALAALAAGAAAARSAAAQAAPAGAVTGRVVDAASQAPISDVQVIVAGTRLGAVSNANGDFTIRAVPVGTQQITARRIGFAAVTQPAAVPAEGSVRLDFALRTAATQLDQVVVTGTGGAVEKRTVGNAVTQVDVADVTRRTNVTNVTEVLQARSPGVQIAAGSGTPGTASDIRIRGASSFSVTRPVVFIDGVRMNSGRLGNFDPSGQGLAANSGGQTANAFDLVNPEDIESVEIIKGPAAATLYGADAAGGVIQIITKKGARGQQSARWTARLEGGRNDVGSVDLPTNYTTCDAVKQAAAATWPGCQGVPLGTVLQQSPIGDDPNATRNGNLRALSLSVRGGGDRYAYYVSGDHDYEEGVLFNSQNRRDSFRSNFSFAPNEKSDLQISASAFNGRLRLPLGDESAQGILFSSQRGRPGRVSSLVGQPTDGQEGYLTVAPAASNLYNNQTRTNRVTLGVTGNYQPVQWFRNRLTVGLDWTDVQATLFAPPNTPDLTGDTLGLTAQRLPRNTLYTLDYNGTVERGLGASLVSTTSVGTQVIASRDEVLSASGVGLGSRDVTLIGGTTRIAAANSFEANNSVGYYAQEQLGWRNRLFATVALRADDNSSFGTDFDIITYPKASLAWVLSEEPAAKRLVDALRTNNLKLRAAWGQAGRAPAPYAATRTYGVSVVTLGSGTASAIRTGEFGNPGLRPERGSEYELGFDADLFGSRAGVEFTYYDKRTRDVLFTQAVPQSTGFRGSQQANLGRTANSGIELGLTATPVQLRNFAWDSRVSLSTNRNRLVSFGDTSVSSVTPFASYGAVQQHRQGYPLGAYWARFPTRNPDGTPVLTRAGALVLDTAVYIGPSTPTREIALSNTFTLFRNFSLYSLFDYKAGHYNYRGADLYRCGVAANCRQLNDPNFPASEVAVYRSSISNAPHGVYIHEADFVKLRDLSLTYTVPARLAARLSASAASVTVAGRNLAIWSDYPGPDPEVNTYGNRAFVRGDIYSMPMTRRVSAALNLTF